MTMPHRRRRIAPVLVAIAVAAACSTSPVTPQPATSSPSVSSESGPAAETRGTVDPTPVLAAADALVSDWSSANAQALVDAVAADPDERWVPWLVDLLRLDPSSSTSQSITETLASITGVPSESRVPDMTSYGSWSMNRGLDGGPGYRDFKIALYERIDPEFGPLAASVDDQRVLAGIQWGGVRVGGIPELNSPERVTAAAAGFMADQEVVLGINIDGEALAYPLRVLARHELANDTVAGLGISIVYCTLCRSATVFERRVEGRALNFITSGLLSNSNKIMLDRETRTLWNHLGGIGIGGPLSGVELERLPVTHMRWGDWVTEHPNTQVVALPSPIFFDDPERPPIAYDYTPGEAYRAYYENPDVWFPILDTPDVWPIKTEVLGIAIDDDALAISVEELNTAGSPITVEVAGRQLTIEPTGVGGRVIDERGEIVQADQLFWFAWYSRYPLTRTLDL